MTVGFVPPPFKSYPALSCHVKTDNFGIPDDKSHDPQTRITMLWSSRKCIRIPRPESLLVFRHFQTMSIACHMSRPTLICLRRYVRTYCLLSFKLISTVLLSTVKLNSGQFSFTVRRMEEVLDNPRADKTLLDICHTKRLVLSALFNGIPWGRIPKLTRSSFHC